MMGASDRGGRPGRHEQQNRERGERAREHLERARQKERRRLQQLARDRARQGRGVGAATRLWQRLRPAACFLLALIAGILLASPLQDQLARMSLGGGGRLESIAIQGNERLSFTAVANATGVAPGTRLAEIDPALIEQRLRQEAWIREARVVRLPPSTLLVRVMERRPVALLEDLVLGAPASASGRLVDASGTPFAHSDEAAGMALPRFVGGSNLASGESHAVLLTGLELFERLGAAGEAGFQPQAGALVLKLPAANADEGWVLRMPDRSLEVVLGQDRVTERFERLRELLRAGLPETSVAEGAGAQRAIVRIDLRFEDQAVLRQTQPREATTT